MEYKLLDECCEILDSQRVPITESDREPGPYPYYGANGVQDYVADYLFDDELVLLAEDGGNFGSKTRPIAFRVSGKCWVNNHAHVLKPKDGFDVDYICYSLMFYDTSDLVNGATRQKLTQAAMRKMRVPNRSMDEQLEISGIIQKTTDIINQRKKEIEELDALIKARFVEMFGDLKINPYGYDKRELRKTCKVITGNTPSRDSKEYYGDFVEWIKTDNIVPGRRYPTGAAECLSEKGTAVGRTVDKGAILMACIAGSVASIGRVCITNRKVAFNQQINAIVPHDYDIHFLYVMLQIAKDYLVEEINMALKGILSKSKLEDKVFYVPPIDLQKEFASFVRQVDKSKAAIERSLDETQLLFDSLMQGYFG